MNNLNMHRLDMLVKQVRDQKFKSPQEEDIHSIMIELRSEKDSIIFYADSCTDQKSMMYYIRSRQRQIVRLMDTLNDSQVIENEVFKELGQILNFLERDFSDYLDENCKLPVLYVEVAQESLAHGIQFVDNGLKHSGVDPQLIDIVMRPFRDFLAGEGADYICTYQELDYLKTLQEGLKELVLENDAEAEIQVLLYQFNFNDPLYFKYLTAEMKKEIEAASDFKSKRDLLFFLLKEIAQMPVFPGMHFKKLYKPLGEQLQKWITAEIRYLTRITPLQQRDMVPGELDAWRDFKVKTNLSVAQLGRLLGMLWESGIILNKNKVELTQFFSLFFSSVDAVEIAHATLRLSFSDNDPALTASIRQVLDNL
jgi:hypothetical protein